jgi:hypothetical protein
LWDPFRTLSLDPSLSRPRELGTAHQPRRH